MSDTMTALVADSGAWHVRDVPVPTPGPGQLLIRAAYVALNNADVVALDAHNSSTEPKVAGYELSGTVVAVGDGIDGGRVGASVMASTTQAFAELVLADSRHAIDVPESLSLEQAAALPTALLTEYGALRAGGFEAGQDVLLLGATSAIGIVGVQLVCAMGARRLLATTRSADKESWLLDHGADVVIDTTDGLGTHVLDATGGEGVHLVLDHVGGQLFADALASTRRNGTVVQIGRLGGADSQINLANLAHRRLTVRGVSFGEADELAELLSGVTRDVMPLLDASKVRPVLHDVLTFDRASDAAELVRAGRAQGKVVLSVP